MTILNGKRAIIDRKALVAELDGIATEHGGVRSAVLERLRAALETGRAEARRRFERGLDPSGRWMHGQSLSPEAGNGDYAVAGNCYLIDQILRAIHDFALAHVYPNPNPSRGERLAVIAVGGYGRGELAPYSDIDILFLTPHKTTAHSEQIVEYILYMLWDLGLKLGHATRAAPDCLARARRDMTVRTALVDRRYLWGDRGLYAELSGKLATHVERGAEAAFIEAKLAERDARHRKHGGSRYSLEPNVKEGKGGLRDLHTLFWIMKYTHRTDDPDLLVDRKLLTHKEAKRFRRARTYLNTVRCHIHYLAGRADERLTFDMQHRLADRMGYRDRAGGRRVERFMKHYFLTAKDVGDLTRIFCAALEAAHKRRPILAKIGNLLNRKDMDGFPIDGGRLSAAGPEHFDAHPIDLLRIFRVAQRRGLDIHPNALRYARQRLRLIDARYRERPLANRLFLDILSEKNDPEWALRRMSESGVLGKFIPDFGRCVARMQYNMYHHYTVDEHTLMAVGILAAVERGERKGELPIASEIVHSVLSRKALYFAVFMHDVAKGLPGDHSQVGAGLCRRLCPRLGFTDDETETIAWLVEKHLLMSDVAFKRDLDDPKTIEDFCKRVQSPENLRLLLCLTVADIRAVGPNVWNNWKASLLRQLYWRAEEVLSGGLTANKLGASAERNRDALRARLADWPAEAFDAFVKRGTNAYWLAFDVDAHALHARMMQDMERNNRPVTIDCQIRPEQGITEVTVMTADRPGLLPCLAGGLAVCGASIVGARVQTFSNGIALDMFQVQETGGLEAHNRPIAQPEKLARLTATLEQALSGALDIEAALKAKPTGAWAGATARTGSAFAVPPRALIDNKGSETHTIVEVNGLDRPGFLYRITQALNDSGVQISNAMIATYGERAVDVFYVKDLFGLKIVNADKLEQIRGCVLAAVRKMDGRTEKPRKSESKTKSAQAA